MQAEDRCRGEHFEKIRRRLVRASTSGRLPMDVEFNATQPWIGVFTFAARDAEYWQEKFVKPALQFVARGGAGRKMPRELAEEVGVADGAKEALAKVTPNPPGEGTSRAARKRRKVKELWTQASEILAHSSAPQRWQGRESSPGPKGGGKGGKAQSRPKKAKRLLRHRSGWQSDLLQIRQRSPRCMRGALPTTEVPRLPVVPRQPPKRSMSEQEGRWQEQDQVRE